MNKTEIKTIGHMDYLLPFTSELTVPYRAKQPLKDKILYIFTHPTLPKRNRDLFRKVSTQGSKALVNDMACVAIALVKYFTEHQQQFGGSMENIEFQVLRRMWLQTYRNLYRQNSKLDEDWKYLGTSMRMLSIENGLWDELLRVVKEQDYYQTNDDMVKKRQGVGLRERRKEGVGKASLREGGAYFEYLCNLE